MPRKTIAIFRPGGQVNDLRGRAFGLLVVTNFAGVRREHAYWCCRCKCLPGCKDCGGAGCTVKVLGSKLVRGLTRSCGCSRTDPETRRKAAMKVPVRVRLARAEKAAAKCRGVVRHPAYKLTVSRAADLLNVSTERVIEMSREGILRTVYRKSTRKIMVSATDVAEYIGARARNAKSCPVSNAKETEKD